MRLSFSVACGSALFVVATGCGAPTVTFDVPVNARTTVERGTVVDQLLDQLGFADLASVDLEATEEFENNDVRREQVVAARVTSLNLAVEAPQGANFDWLDAVRFSVAAGDVAAAEVGSADIADGTAAVACVVNDVDIAEFVRKSRIDITTEATARRPPQDTTVRVDVTFQITAEVL